MPATPDQSLYRRLLQAFRQKRPQEALRLLPAFNRFLVALLFLCLSVTGGPGILAGLALIAFLSPPQAHAANIFFDQNGVSAGTGFSSSGGSALWGTSSLLWVNAGTATTTSGTLAAGSYTFSGADTAFFTGNGGTLSLGTLITLGSITVSTTAPLTLAPGGGSIRLGSSGSFTIGSGGLFSLGAFLDGASYGLTKSGAGIFQLSGAAANFGVLNVSAGTVAVAVGGSLTVQTGASVTNVLKVGNGTGTGVLTIAPGASVTTGYLQMGLGNSSSGAVINQGTLVILYSGGNNSSAFDLGNNSSGYGYYRHDTQTPVSTSNLSIGGSNGGSGVLDLMTGSLNSSVFLMLARDNAYQNAQLNVFGGSLSIPNNGNGTFMFYSATSNGTEVINILSGGVVSGGANSILELNRSSTVTSGTVATGMVNLQQGGILSVQSVKATQSAGATFLNMDGGTLKPTASGTAFVNNLTGFYLYSNGGTIETSGFNVTIPESILSPSGYGLASGTITMPPVGGYIGRPIVLLTTSGTGMGASAIADFNVNTGTVGGIIVTSPGFGYGPNDTITASFLGGGSSAGSLTLSGGSLVSNTRPNMGGLTKTGAGTLTLSSTNTYAGTTTVSAGMLQITTRAGLNNGTFSASKVAVQSGAVLGLNFGGPNDFIASDLALLLAGSSSVFANNSTLALDTSNAIGEAIYSGNIAGSNNGDNVLSLRKAGSGSLTLSGNNSYSGGTTLWAGTLNLNHASALGTGSLTIAGGALDNTSGAPQTLLNNNPQFWNSSFVFNGSNDLNLGTGPVTLGLSSTVTVNASTLSLGGNIGGAYGLSKAGPGTLVLNGANTYTGITYVLGGSLILGGTMTSASNGLKIGSSIVQILSGASLTEATIAVGYAAGSQAAMYVNGGLVVSTAAASSNPLGVGESGFGYLEVNGGSVSSPRIYFSGSPTLAPGTGVGLLNGGTLAVADVILARSGTASAASGMLTVTGGSLVQTGAYFSIGWGGSLAVTGTSIVNLQGGNIDTSGQIFLGTSSLSSQNPYAGEAYLNLNGGILRSGTINFGTIGAQYVNFNGGTLRANISSANLIPANSASGSVNLYKNGATIDSNGFNITIPANLAAPTGSGFSGGTITNAGTGYTGAPFISVSGSGGFGASAYATVNNGTIASIVVSSPGSNYTGPLTLKAMGGGGSGFVYTPMLATNIGGGLTKTGAGTLTLSGTNGYSGTTTVSAGMLQFARRVSLYNAGTSQWTASNIVVKSGATFAVNLGGTGEFALTDIPLLLVGSNNGGFLSGSILGIDMTNASGGTLYAGVIANPNGGANSVGLQKWGPASLTLSGANTHTGGTTLTSGSLILSGGSNRLSTTGAINIQGGVLDLGGNSQSTSGAFTLAAGTLQNGTLIGTGTAFVLQSGSILASLTGSAGLNKTGAGTVVLGAPSTSTGDIRIDGGILQIGLGGVSGSLSLLGSIANNGALVFKRSDSLTQGVDFGTISGSGGLTQLGSGSLVMTSFNTYTGTTTISAGTLMLGTGGTNGLLSATSSIVNNGLLILNHSDVLSQGSNLASNISGNGGILQLGGSLVLSGTILSTTGSLMIGNATATLVAGGSIREGTVQIGADSGTVGALTINGGSLTVLATGSTNNYGHLSVGDGGFGYLEINGGLLTSTTSWFAVAASTAMWTSPVSGVVYMSNGSVSFPSLYLARHGTLSGSVNGVFTVVGGTLAVDPIGTVYLGNYGTGTAALNIQGGLVDHSFGRVTMGNTTVFSGQSFLNLNGGTLKTGSLAFSSSVPSTYINFNGGTLQAGAQGVILIPALSSAVGGVFAGSGGATLDTNGFDVTVAAGILAVTGSGLASVSLTGGSSGYTGAPLVKISGGGGAGASGYATVSNGTLSSIVITSSGTGYTSAPTLTLTGGGGPDTILSTTIAPNISGGLTKNGAGTLTLTGANTYTGETAIMNGILQIGAGGATGSIASSSNVRNNGTLAFNLSSATSQSNITGTGSVRQMGAGVTILGGTNSYAGTTSIEAGTLQFSTPSALYGADTTRWNASHISVSSGATFAMNVGGTGFAEADVNSVLSMGSAGGVFANGAALAFDTTNAPGGAFEFSGAISNFSGNTLGVSKLGQGALTLSGENTFSGLTTINAGTLELRGGSALPDMATVNLQGGQLLVSESETIGVIQGTTSGTINLGDGATLTLGSAGYAGTLPAKITGAGSLNFVGGSLNLSAGNTFLGDVSIKAGTLVISNNTTLNGTGQVNRRTVFIDAGAVLQLNPAVSLVSGGTSITSITGSGSLLINAVSVALKNPAMWGGGVIDVQAGILLNPSVPSTDWTSNLAGLNIGPNGNFRNWNGQPVYVDAITGSGLIGGSSQVSYSSANITFGVNSGSGEFSGTISYVTGNLIKTGTGTQVFSGENSYAGQTQIWNGTLSASSLNSVSTGSLLTSSLGSPTTAPKGTIVLGSLATTGALLYTGTGETSDRILNLSGTTGGGLLDHSGTGVLKFTALSGSGYLTATGAGAKTLTLQGSSSGIGEMAAVIVNNSALNTTAVLKQGSGTWILSGTNTYTGGTTLNDGSLLLSSGSNRLATTGSILVAGGTLDLGGFSQSTSGTITFAGGVSQNGTLISTGTVFNAMGGSVQAILAGTQGLVKTTAGVLTLLGVNKYTGATTLSAGSLFLAGGSNRLATTGSLNLSGGVLDLGGNAQTTSGTITISGATVQNGVLTNAGTAFVGQAGVVSAILDGTLGLLKSTSATLTLTGANTYTGATTVTSGVLTVSNAGSLSPLTNLSVSNNAQFNYLPSASGTLTLATGTLNSGSSLGVNFGATILFTGAVSMGGTVNLSPSGSYTNGVTYTLLQAGSGLNTGTYNVTGANDYEYTLGLTPTAVTITPTYIGPIKEAYWKGGQPGAPTAWGVSNWSSTSGGALQSRNPGAATNVILDGNGTNLDAMTLGSNVSVGFITTAASFSLGTLGYTAGLLLSLGSSEARGMVTSNAGTLTIHSDIILVSDSTFTNNSAGTLTFGGIIGGTSALVKSGSGMVLFSGANTYSGTTTITEGILQIGAGGSSGGLSPNGFIVNNGTLVFNRSDVFTQGTDFGTVLSGTGSLVKPGAGTMVLTGANTYTGESHVLEGVLNVRHANGLGSGVGSTNVAAGAALEMQGGITIASESLVLSGTGIANGGALRNISGSNTFGGPITLAPLTRINADSGTLVLNGAVASSGGSLAVGGSGSIRLGGAVSLGAGSIIKDGTGSVSLGGAGNYSGATIISAGTLQVGTGGTTGGLSSASAILNNALLVFSRSNTATQGADFGMLMSGSGSFQKSGTGTLILNGTNTYSGSTIIEQGTLTIAQTGSLPSGGSLIFGAASSSNVGKLDLSNASATVANLLVQTNTSTTNLVTIGTGQSLTVSGGSFFSVGAYNNTAATSTKLTFSGAGSLNVTMSSGSLSVGRMTSANTNTGILDLTALVAFNLDASEIRVGVNKSPHGYLYLSNTANSMTVSKIGVGDGEGSGAGTVGKVTLGQGSNVIVADNIFVGLTRSSGTFTFQYQTAGTLGTASIRGNTQPYVNIYGGTQSISTATSITGIIDFRGHSISVTAGTVILGLGPQISGTGAAVGHLSMDAGSFSVNTLTMGSNIASGTFSGTNAGTLNIGGGTFTVNSGGSVLLASSATNTSTVKAAINLTGGSLVSNADIVVGGGTNALATLSLLGGTLDLTGHNLGSLATAGSLALNIQSGRLQNMGLISGTAGITKTTAGVLTLAGTNTFTGGVSLSAGTLNLNSPEALGTGSLSLAAASSLNNTSGAALTLANNNPQLWNGDFTFAGSNPLGLGTGTVSMGTSTTITVTGSTLTLGGAIYGDGLTLSKAGFGTLVLAGTTFVSNTILTSGTLVAGASSPFGDSLLQVNTGHLDLRGFAVSASSLTMSGGMLSLALGNVLSLSGTGTLAGTIQVSGNPASLGGARYSVASAVGGWSGSFNEGSVPDSLNYRLQINDTSLDLQHRATLSLSPTFASQSVHTGSTAISVAVGNTAPVNSDTLYYALSGSISGSGYTLAAGSSTILTGNYLAVPGINSLSVTATPTSSIATSNGTQNTTFTVTGYSLAAASGSQTVDFGTFRAGTQPWRTLSISNLGPVSALYSEALSTNGFSGTTSNLLASGAATAVAAGSSANGTLRLQVAAGVGAGVFAGTTTLGLVSNAVSGSGLSDTALASQTIHGTGAMYDYANPVYSGGTIAFGNMRVGGAAAIRNVAFANAPVSNADYQDALDVSATTNNSKVSALGFSGLLAGAGTASLTVSGTTTAAGGLGSTLSLLLVSNTNGVSGLSNAPLAAPAPIVTTGGVYDYANPVYTGGTVAFGNVRVGGTLASHNVGFTNAVVSNASYQDSLDVSATSNNSRVSAVGFAGLLAGAGTGFLQVSGTTATAGALASTLALGLGSNTNGVSGLSSSSLAAASTITTSGGVFDYANPVYAGGTFDFGNVRVNGAFSGRSIVFTNPALTNAAYQDSLDVSATADNAMVSATGFTALAAGTGNASLVLNAATGTPGSLSSTLALSLVSNTNGVAGLAAQSLTPGSGLATTGGVYAYAKPTYSTGTITFGNVHVGDSSSFNVSNPSSVPAFQDALDLSLSLPEGITGFSGTQTINAGSSLSVFVTAHARGALSGTAVVTQTSNANGLVGLGNGTLDTKMLPISGTAYALAEGRVGAASLGNFHVGVAKNITLFNAATAGLFSEDLSATLASVSNTLVAGSVAHLIAGGSNDSSLSVTLVSAGTGSFRLELESTATVNGTPVAGLSPTTLAPQILSITQNAVAYNMASVSSAQAVDLGNVRRGEQVTVPLSLSNTAPMSAYFTETLSSSGFSNTSPGVLAGGSVSGIEGGTSGIGSLFVGFSNGLAAGVQSGTTMLGVRSNAVIGSGLNDTALPPQKVTVSGVVYDYANPVYNGGTIAFGNLRVGEALASKSVAFANAVVSNASYQDALDGSAVSSNSKISATGFTGLLAGSGTASLIVAGTTVTAGNLGSTLALLLVSNTNGVTGLTGSTLAAPSAIMTSGGVYDYANPVYAGGTLDFGNVRVGSAPTTKAVTFSNAVINSAAYQDSLDVSASSSNPRVVANGFTGLAAGAGTQSLSVSLETGSAGSLASALALSLTSNARGVAGLFSSTLNPTAVITSTGSVFAYAQPLWSNNLIAFGNVHVGTVRAVSVTNSAVAPSGYQDSLEVTGVGTDKVSITSGTFKVTAGASRSLTLTAFAPGPLTGFVSISQRSHANGVDGLLDGPLSTVNLGVTGAAYALAAGSVDVGSLGNFHVGVPGAVTLKNTAAPGLFSEDLSATLSSISNTIVSGSVNALVAGAIDNSHLMVTLTGPGSGSVRLNLESTGSVGGVSNGLGATVLGSQTLNLSAAGYALATTNFEDTMLDLGAVRQNESFGFRPVAITNTLSMGVYSENLRASFVGGQGVSTRGGTAVISAGSTASGVLSVGLAGSTAGAGTLAGTVQVEFSSQEVNHSGLGNTPLPDATRTISVSGKIYRLASGSLTQRVELGAIREGGTFPSKAVTVRNTAANDGFSDDLKAVFVATSSSSVETSGIVSRLGAGLTSDTLQVGFNVGQTKAGLVTGTASVGYTSLGRAGTGLADAPTALRGQDVTFGGKIYRLATGTLNALTLDFGAVRAASGTSTATLVVRNTAAGDGFSDLLGVIAATGGAFQVATGSLLIGGTSNGSVVVSYAPGNSSAGLVKGSLSVAMRSVGQSDTNYDDVSVGTQTVGIRATVFRPAVGALRQSGTLLVSGGTVSLAPVRVGVAFTPLSLDVLNTASRADAYSESLNVGTVTASGFAVSSGSAYLVAPGKESAAALSIGLNTSATGTTGMKTGGLTWSFETDGTGTSGLGKALTGTWALNISGQVYDGKGVWSGGSGAWSDWRKWTVSGGRPGMDNGASVVSGDTARIDSGAGPVSVSLPGGTLNLAGLSLSGSGGVSLSGVGTIALAGTMGASSGAHSVSADVVLINPSRFVVEQGAKLTIGGLVSGGTLTKQGAGTLQLAAGYRSMASASVESGRLMLGNGTSVPEIGDSLVSVAGGLVRTIYLGLGAELAFNVSRNLNLVNLEIIGPGAANVSSVNPNFVVNWKNGLSEEEVKAGEVVDLSDLSKKTNLKVSDATFTLGTASKDISNALTVSGSLGVSVAGSGRVTFRGVIGGTGALVKENAGIVTLAGSNSFAGGTRVNAGTVIAQNPSALGTGTVTLAPPARVVLDLTGAGTVSNVILGGGSVVKSGSGIVTLSSANNNYSGGTTVSTGTLVVTNSKALGTGAVSVAASASLMVSGSAGSTIVLANGLSGSGSLRANSSGTVSLTGLNTLSGSIVLSAGTLNIFSSAALGTGGLVLSGGVLNLRAPLTMTAPLALSGQSGLVTTMGPSTLSGPISGVGTLRLSGALTGATNVTSGAVTISGGTLNSLLKTGTGALIIEGSTQLKGTAVVASGRVTVSNASQTLAGVTTLVVGNKGSSGAVLNVGANGAILSGGQTLKGIGTVSGVMKLASGSRLSPGNSIGTESILGRLEVGREVVYDPEFKMVGSFLSSDSVRVIGADIDTDGTVTAGSMLLTGGIVKPKQDIEYFKNKNAVDASKGTWLSTGRITDFIPHRFTILSSTIGAVITGTFDGVVSGAVLKSHLEYVNGDQVVSAENAAGLQTVSEAVQLVMQRVPYRLIGGVGGRAEVGHGLDVSLATKDPLLWNVLDILDASQSEGEVLRVLDQLNPKVFAEVYSLALSRLQDVQKTVSDRLTLLGTALTTMGEAEVLSLATGQGSEWTAWTNAYGSWSAREANPSLGEGGSSRSSAGNVTGVERRFGALTLGLLGALGTSSTQMNQPGASITSESWHLGLYMSTPLTGRVFVDGSVVFGEGENVLKRIQTVPITDEYGTRSTLSLAGRTRLMNQEWLVQLGVGAQLAAAGSRWSMVPTLRAAYAGVRQPGAHESGAGSLGIESDSKWNGTVLTRTGLDIAREGRLGTVPVRATGSAAWVHDFAADSRRLGVKWQGVDAAPWTISSARRSADVLRLGLSLELGLGERRTLRLYGEQEYLQNMKILRGGVTFTIGF